MQKLITLQSQIKALTQKLNDGKVKNIYALKNKIKNLQIQVQQQQQKENWNEFLGR